MTNDADEDDEDDDEDGDNTLSYNIGQNRPAGGDECENAQ